MAESLFHIVQLKTWEQAFSARYISVSANEIIAMDNTTWVFVHLYIVVDWEQARILLSVSKVVNGARAKLVTKLVMDSLTGDSGNLKWKEVVSKLVSVGGDSAPMFQGQ